MSHDWSFLEGDKRHTHTLKAGHHSFPFSLILDGNLPSSIQTYAGDAIIGYNLRVDVVRSGFSSNYHDSKSFTLTRTYTPEALEFNQTLEIENTWPGKVMYALTLPFKAYAAGDDIPVRVKFMPLAKGVKVLSITSVVKEYSRSLTRNSSHADSRVAVSVKHELRRGQAIPVSEEPQHAPSHYLDSRSHGSSRNNSLIGLSSLSASPSSTPVPQRLPRGSDSGIAEAPGLSGPSELSLDGSEDLEIGDDEVDTSISIPIPPWTNATHSVHPVFITHKIKWSCSISNPDGHVSELRCALPIIILDHSLLEEARAAGASSRGLLFGGVAAAEAQQVDLPSYNNHVADSGNASGFLPRSTQATPLPSPPSATPPSHPPSRPASPNRNRSYTSEPDDIPPRRQLSSWADSELLLSLGSLQTYSNGTSPHETPGTSRGPSRPLSRRDSRSGRSSGRGSRASSPERGDASVPSGQEAPQSGSHRSSGFHILNHLPFTSKPILRNSSAAALHCTSAVPNGPQRNSVSFTNLPDRGPNGHGDGHVAFAQQGARRSRFHVGGADTPSENEAEPINQVPSYAIASRGFLGGGVVPINGGPPMYHDSERIVDRTRSDTALDRLGAEETAALEAQASECMQAV